MIKKIRNKTFETNSSSMHSLSILNTNNEGNLENLKLHVGFGEYGWGWDVLSSPQSILNYLWTMCNCSSVDVCEPYRSKMLQWLPNCIFEEGKIRKERNVTDPYFYYDIDGYIDHCYDWYNDEYYIEGKFIKGPSPISEIFKSKEVFTQVIFNGKIIISSDGSDSIFTEEVEEVFDSTHAYLSEEEKRMYTNVFIPSNAIKSWVKGN